MGDKMINPNTLTKKEKKIFFEGRCRHRHLYSEHPNCFRKEILEKDGDLKEGYLDIESTGFEANFHHILTYVIKEKGKDVYHTGEITKEDLDAGIFDKNVCKKLVKDLEKFDIIYTYYGCVTPGHKVLTSDFKWVPVESLVEGDELVGFDETGNKREYRRYKKSKVVANIPLKRDVYKITLSNGKTLTATGDHPWLVKTSGKWGWTTTDKLIVGNRKPRIQSILPTWDEKDSYNAGYIAAFIDGEGCVSNAVRGRGYQYDKAFSVAATQSKGAIADEFLNAVTSEGYQFTVYEHDRKRCNGDKYKPLVSMQMLGKRADKVKMLGEVRPVKLQNIGPEALGRVTEYEEFEILNVEYVGEQTICGLQTTSSTYIVDGFGCHNTGFDNKFMRSRCMYWGITFPEFGKLRHKDLYYVTRRLLKLHRCSLDAATKFLGIEGKNHVLGKEWMLARVGNKKALEYVMHHNKLDCDILEKLHEKLENYFKRTFSSV
jgi:uncharacterized protein YprB with RNaseH-like and TPR domain